MIDESRRNFLKLAAGGLVSLALGACRPKVQNPITSEEYNHIFQAMKDLGYDIDKAHSNFRRGSGTLIVYLPEDHTPGYQKKQKKTIKALDKAIDFDAIGLEGLLGDVDAHTPELGRFVEEKYKFLHSLVKKSDTKFSELQRLIMEAGQAYDKFSKTPEIKNDNLRPQTRERHFTLGKLGEELAHIYKYRKFFLEFESIKRFDRSNPNLATHGAPGLNYFNLDTRAKKMGIESQDDGEIFRLGDAGYMQTYISALRQGIERIRALDKKLESSYDSPELQESKQAMSRKINDCVSYLEGYLREAEQHRDQLLDTLSPEMKKAALDCGCKIVDHGYGIETREFTLSSGFRKYVLDQRTEHWIDNVAPNRIVMIAGGSDHAKPLYDLSSQKNCSVITLA